MLWTKRVMFDAEWQTSNTRDALRDQLRSQPFTRNYRHITRMAHSSYPTPSCAFDAASKRTGQPTCRHWFDIGANRIRMVDVTLDRYSKLAGREPGQIWAAQLQHVGTQHLHVTPHQVHAQREVITPVVGHLWRAITDDTPTGD